MKKLIVTLVGCLIPVAACVLIITSGSESSGKIPVLLYHGIYESKEDCTSECKYATTLADFEKQMSYLHRSGYETISPTRYAKWVDNEATELPDHPIVITFDDGLASQAQAVPIMEEYDFRPVMYVASGFTDQFFAGPKGEADHYMTWDQLESLRDDHDWYMQFHAGPCGHVYITQYSLDKCLYGLVDVEQPGYFYTHHFGQNDKAYHERVKSDIASGMNGIRSILGRNADWFSVSIAVPGDAWIQDDGRDWLSRYFSDQFDVIWIQGEAWPGTDVAEAYNMRYRFEVDGVTPREFKEGLLDPRFDYYDA